MFKHISLALFLLFFNTLQAQKNALLIGVGDYPTASGWNTLNAANDLDLLQETLQTQGFKQENIELLKEETATRSNILAALEKLINQTRLGDIVWIHFSGHGQQVADNNRDEIDGFDEAIVPYDSPKNFELGKYEGEQLIRDEELGAMLHRLRQRIGESGQLVLSLDACHSGTGTRSSAIQRGTDVKMASQSYIKQWKANSQIEKTFLDANHSKQQGFAPMVNLFSSGARQMSYEYTTPQGTSYGIFTYSLCKVLNNLTKQTTFQALFDLVKLEMSGKALRQIPQIEGDIKQVVFNNAIVGSPPHYMVKEVVGGSPTINAGELQGLHEGTNLSFYAIGSSPLDNQPPIVSGYIDNADLWTADVLLDEVISKEVLLNTWVFVEQKSFGKLQVRVQIVKQAQVSIDIAAALSNRKIVQLVEDKPELIINADGETLSLISKEGDLLLKTKYSSETIARLEQAIEDYLKASFLRNLQVKSVGIAAEIYVHKQGRRIASMNEIELKVGEVIELEIINTGNRPFYFSVLDIMPNNSINAFIPYDKVPQEYYLEPNQSYITDLELEIQKPLGREVFKLLASPEPLYFGNLQSTSTRGLSTIRNPLAILIGQQQLDTRGSNGQYTDIGTVKSLIFKIIE